ncbi:MAG: hypothetical protein ABH952_00300 [Candidatus Omnitrophota bacterium]
MTELGEYLAAVSKTMAAGRKINEVKDVLRTISTLASYAGKPR